MKQSSLLCHLDIDARSLGVGVSHHVLDRLDVHTLLNQQRPEGVPQRVGRNLRVADTDTSEPLLHDAADGLPDKAVVAPAFMGNEQRIVLCKVTVCDILLQPLDGVRMQDDDLILVHAALALDVEDRLAFTFGDVPDVDALHLAGAKPVEEHQRDHQPVAASDNCFRIDAF